ncbi:ribosome biogenesis protein slx9 [Ctenocephalides felis]|uniref:ribosome biogenesis protein slx9 n=1 Tax=Ctenocephalides felis TaxID=7515 RepID=UPI000E6E364C|nr:ribosome biogenesis protein slx9 [Ctenocephalides felis]
MGKVRRLRNKAAKAASNDNPHSTNLPENASTMSYAQLKKSLSDIDTKSVKSFKSLKSEMGIDKQLSKKDKQKLRHDLFLHKIDTTIKSRSDSRKKNRKLKKAISGNLVELHDALPSLKSLLKPKDAPVTKNLNAPKQKAIQKTYTRQKQNKADKNLFKRLMDHPEFKKNPQEVIAAHIQATLMQNN